MRPVILSTHAVPYSTFTPCYFTKQVIIKIFCTTLAYSLPKPCDLAVLPWFQNVIWNVLFFLVAHHFLLMNKCYLFIFLEEAVTEFHIRLTQHQEIAFMNFNNNVFYLIITQNYVFDRYVNPEKAGKCFGFLWNIILPGLYPLSSFSFYYLPGKYPF